MLNNAHLGNGITVWDNSTIDPRTNDYLTVAHINHDRTVTFYYSLPANEKQKIFDIAFNDDRGISATQDTKVFNTRPNEVESVKVRNLHLSKNNPKRDNIYIRNPFKSD
jgi:hypothetical protein